MRVQRVGKRALAGAGTTAVALALIIGVGTFADAAVATGEIRSADSAAAIPGSYIVTLKDGTVTTSRAATLAKKYDGAGTVAEVYTAAVKGFHARMSPAAAKRLAADPAVAMVEQDQIMSITGTQTGATWGIDRLDQASLPLNSTYTYPNTASNVHAYVIDTGILTTHSQFGGRAVSGYDYVDNDSNATDCNGHGTHVAGTIGGSTYGVAKAVQLVAVRVLSCSGSGSTSGVISGVNWVAKNAIKPAVANMSLGGGVSTTLDNAVAAAVTAGVSFAVAAGNDNTNACNNSPARVASAITVGATTKTDARASYSNYGSCLDVFAPGSSITSSWYTSTSATNTISGTSMASPHVAGVAALVLSANPSYTPAQVTSRITGTAAASKVTSPGTSSPNRLLQVVN